jgi:hypothetical protein
VAGVLVAALTTGCGPDPTAKADPTADASSPSTGVATDPEPSSTFPPDAALPDGPWIPSPTLRIKVPRGFKGDGSFGVTTLSKGPLSITITDYASLGESDVEAFAEQEKRSIFGGEATYDTGVATVDGQEVQTFRMTGDLSALQRVSYGFLVTDGEGEAHTVVVGFMAPTDPTVKYQDTIDSVLASIRWTKAVVG